MRAHEFIIEAAIIVKTGIKLSKESEAASPGAHRVAGTADRLYDLNRIMMFAAVADGKTKPDVPRQSWAGRNNTAHPYTKEEMNMLKHAYEMADVEWQDVLDPNPNNKSQEMSEINKTSPVSSFRGYSRK